MHPSIGLFIKLFYVILKLTNLYKDRERKNLSQRKISDPPPEYQNAPPPDNQMARPLLRTHLENIPEKAGCSSCILTLICIISFGCEAQFKLLNRRGRGRNDN